MATDLSEEDQKFLAQCEEEFKDRFTEKDEEFMKVYNSEPSKPPIIENWYGSQSYGRRNDRRNNRHHPYARHGNRDRDYQDRHDRQDRQDRPDRQDRQDRPDRQDRREYSRGYNDYQGYYDNRPRRGYY